MTAYLKYRLTEIFLSRFGTCPVDNLVMCFPNIEVHVSGNVSIFLDFPCSPLLSF